jgi:hypothetical protein
VVALAIAFAPALAGCGAPGGSASTGSTFPPGPPKVTEPAEGATPYKPPSALDESRKAYARATATTDARERCRWLREASTLDAANVDARAALAESRCAPARELLEDARAAFKLRPDAKTAAILITVSARTRSKPDLLVAASAVEKGGDLDARLAVARALARVGDHARAATIFEGIATERLGKGAQLDGIDARLEAVMERARSGAPVNQGLIDAITEISPAASAYGAAWVELKLVDAIASVRAAGDDAGANEAIKQAKARKLLAGREARRALELEEAIAAGRRDAKAKPLATLASDARSAARVEEPSARALLAVEARLAGKCPAARAHADAHDADAMHGLPRFDDDAAWARGCAGAAGRSNAADDARTTPTLVAPTAGEAVEDALAVFAVDASRGRALLATRLEAAPDDVAARVASIAMARPEERLEVANAAVARAPGAPALRLARFPLLSAKAQADEVGALVTTVLPATIEAEGDPRAMAAFLAKLQSDVTGEPDVGSRAVAEATLHACGGVASSSCGLTPAALRSAVRIARRARSTTLSKDAPRLADDDLRDAPARLELVLALLDLGAVREADALASERRGRWEGPEASLALASIEAAQGKCGEARSRLPRVRGLDDAFARDVAWVRERCDKK